MVCGVGMFGKVDLRLRGYHGDAAGYRAEVGSYEVSGAPSSTPLWSSPPHLLSPHPDACQAAPVTGGGG